MKHQRTRGTYADSKKKVIFDLPVVTYEENGLQVIYSPSLDLFGYGKTMAEAKNSFTITIEEFIGYTTHKKTLEKVLKGLGWQIKKSNQRYIAPSLGYMLDENEQFNEIFNTKDFRKFNEQIQVPVNA
ncbi:MAG TPA: hypothetical protein VJY62_02380 [Bacteroidia bacterium]|nr:hypothetical protein [Bacteroidia bacterium]